MLLEKHILPGTHRGVGRPGMEMWRILVLGVLKQGLGCDFDRLHNLANHHETVRAMLGHSDFADKTHYELQTIVDNVSLMRPELLVEVGRLVVESGHAVARKKPGERLRGRCDSFVVETDVHYPTDLGLLWDGVRCLIRETARAAAAHGVGGWRQHRQLGKRVKEGFNPVRSARRGKRTPEKVEAYLGLCRDLVERAEGTVKALVGKGVEEAECRLIRGYIDHARRQIDQVDRRLLQGERIPHQEKVFSIFEPHTRWISKGKAGRPVELGVAVCVVEDQYQFILHHKLLWKEDDVEVAVPMIEETQALYADLRMCSFDRGFHSRNNRIRLDDRLELNALPGKGRRNRAAREREEAEEFAGHETAASGGGVGDQLAGASRSRPGPHPRHRGLRAHGCAVGAGGEPAPPGAAPATAGAGRQETTQTTRRLIGGGVAHTSAFEPAPEETGTAPYGRVPKIGAGPPPITSPRPIAGIFLDEIGLQLARKVWWIVTGKLR